MYETERIQERKKKMKELIEILASQINKIWTDATDREIMLDRKKQFPELISANRDGLTANEIVWIKNMCDEMLHEINVLYKKFF